MAKRRKAQQKGQKRPAPARLHPEERDALNRAFYASDPASYFQERLWTLVELGSKSDAEWRSTQRKFTYGSMTTTVPSVEEIPPDEASHERFLAIEAEMVAHHLAETLWRMFLGHRTLPPCPWVEIAKLRTPGELKRELCRLVDPANGAEFVRGVMAVWLGTEEPPEDQSEVWGRYAEIVADYLIGFSEVVLDRAPAYNAAKHGLAAQPGLEGVDLSAFMPGMSVAGPSLAWLTEQDEDGVPHVAVKTRWIDPQRELFLASQGARLLRGLWTLARIRYASWPMGDGYEPLAMTPLGEVLDIIDGPLEDGGRIVIHSATFPPVMFSPPGSGADAVLARWERRMKAADGTASEPPDRGASNEHRET
jgi:hypothetical protein